MFVPFEVRREFDVEANKFLERLECMEEALDHVENSIEG